MYLDHFGLKERPFSIAPDPRYLFMSQQHREALAHLLYGVRGEGGFVLITGEVGTGKTTVCRCLLGQLPEQCQVAFVVNPRLTAVELLETICDEFRIPYPEGRSSSKLLVDRINRFLLEAHAAGRSPVLLIDEAQNLSVDVLEQVRLLTNLETDQRKLLQVVLIGQPELRELLARPELRQLAQRITARFHLGALSREDLEGYVRHRLAVAGLQHPLFNRKLLDLIHLRTGGVPRLINLVCDRALLGSYVEGDRQVAKRTLLRAIDEVFGEEGLPRQRRWWPIPVMLLLCLGASGWWLQGELADGRLRVPATAPRPAAKVSPDHHLPDEATAESQLADWLQARQLERSPAAFNDLLQVWGRAGLTADMGDPCQAVEARGMRCLQLNGSLNVLRRLNRPALLDLGGSEDRKGRAAVLVGLEKNSCRLQLGGVQQDFPLAQLESSWAGSMLLLWQVPDGYLGPLQPGDEGEQVRQLLAPYAVLLGFAADSPELSRYDGPLLKAMQQFQAAAGLAEEGEVGPQTLIVLSRQVADSGPRLF